MSSIEFETELRGEATLALPPEVVAQLPKSGRAKIVVLVEDDSEDEAWRRASYEQFMRDDGQEDAVYDAYQ
jgi:adenylate kinase